MNTINSCGKCGSSTNIRTVEIANMALASLEPIVIIHCDNCNSNDKELDNDEWEDDEWYFKWLAGGRY